MCNCLYCGTLDVYYAGQIRYDQFRDIFPDLATYENWVLGTLIPEAQTVIDLYCGHDFCKSTGTILLDGSGKQWLPITREGLIDDGDGYEPMELLPLPLIDISSIKDVDGPTEVATPDYNGTDITNYLRYHSYLKRDSGVFRRDEQNIKIVCTWGYEEVPLDIEYVTARMCSNALGEMLRMRNIPDLVKAVMDGSRDVTPLFYNPVILTYNERNILERYRYKELMMA